MMRDLAPLLGRRLSFAVVPNWHGEWSLGAHPDYCRLVQEGSEELLLHGYHHQRERGAGTTTWFAGGSDEMNGLDPDETRRMLERGQRVFAEVFGEPARTFVAPAWQLGHVRMGEANASGLQHVLGFFSLESRVGRKIPLATWTWDCGRWGWLGHIGHGIGWLLQSLDRGIPSLAIHPRDLDRGFWPTILQLTERLLETGYEPSTPAALLQPVRANVASEPREPSGELGLPRAPACATASARSRRSASREGGSVPGGPGNEVPRSELDDEIDT